MQSIKNTLEKIDQILTRWSHNYINKVTRTLYPKPYLDDDDDDDEPVLFI